MKHQSSIKHRLDAVLERTPGPWTAAAALALWGTFYAVIEPLSKTIVYTWAGFSAEERLGAALQFFLYDTAKILLLLVLMVYVLAWLRAGLDVARVRERLSLLPRWAGYLAGAFFGAVTPFCSCSSVPLFLGFSAGGIPIGISLAFLVTSPLVNEVAVVLLWEMLGWRFTVIYVAVGLAAGTAAGFLMDALRAERFLKSYVRDAIDAARSRGGAVLAEERGPVTPEDRHLFALNETRSILKRVALWVVAGVGAGALLHGWVPKEWVLEYLGADKAWSVPAAVAAGMPLYANVTGIVPVMESLLVKGLPVGTTLAFSMSTVAASLPEAIMLSQVMTRRLLVLFFGTLLILFTLIGWFFNAISSSIL